MKTNRFTVVRYCLAMFYLLSILLGFTIHLFNRSKKELQVSKLLTCYSVGLSIIPCMYYKTASELLALGGQRSTVTVVVDAIESILLVYSMFIGTIRRYFKHSLMEEIYRDFKSIPGSFGFTLRKSYEEANTKVLKKMLISIVLVTLPMVCICTQKLVILKQSMDYLAMFTSLYPKLLMVNIVGWNYLMIIYVHRLFELMNQKLIKLHCDVKRELDIDSNLIHHQGKHAQNLNKIVTLRSRIASLALKVEKLSTYTMLVILTLIAILTLGQTNFLFISIYRYFRFNISVGAPMNLAVVFMCVLNLYEAYCIANACEITMEQSRRTAEILYRFNMLDLDIRLKQNIELFLIQLIHQPAKFTALGITIGYTTLLSIISSVTSYLVIVIQFEIASNNCSGKQ
ncbi:uncharacterized protein LOC129728294 [Wyeomyia smithii]|uniref:uncharacterized protein LOC129728294 n=1 Tax=Wyeomyia smithii TaxID=174621 RepID=UPI002467DAF0|nr:uncharacterized protein LOC129728294 [Wyeomyia smithii]